MCNLKRVFLCVVAVPFSSLETNKGATSSGSEESTARRRDCENVSGKVKWSDGS